MNRKGFMLAELLITAVIVTTAIIGLYSSFSKIYANYETRLNYYDIDTLYRLDNYRQIAISNGIFKDLIDEVDKTDNEVFLFLHAGNSGKRYGLGSDKLPLEDSELPPLGYKDTVFLINMKDTKKLNADKMNTVLSNSADENKLSENFKEYITYFNDTVDTTGFSYIMIMERSNKDMDDNKYSYIYFDREGVIPKKD